MLDQELVVRSPVIRPDLPCIARSVATGSVLTSEVELFLRHTPTRVLGVTGSDGKTTTATLLALLLQSGGHTVHLGEISACPCCHSLTGCGKGTLPCWSFPAFSS